MYLVGIDEAGRGALAGPLVVAAVIIPRSFSPPSRKDLPPLRDSKKLSPRQRALWFEYLKNHPRISYVTVRVYPRRIEKLNVARAANWAAAKALEKLIAHQSSKIRFSVALDGGLYLKDKESQPAWAKTIIKGDEKIVAIKLASIIAKIHRDNYMERLHRQYPAYQFRLHKGYGTSRHRQLIKHLGAIKPHRLTFSLFS